MYCYWIIMAIIALEIAKVSYRPLISLSTLQHFYRLGIITSSFYWGKKHMESTILTLFECTTQ